MIPCYSVSARSAAFLLAALLWDGVAFSQTQIITSPRPIEEMADIVGQKYKTLLSYEDTNYNSTIDLSIKPGLSPNGQMTASGRLDLHDQHVTLDMSDAPSKPQNASYSTEIRHAVYQYNQIRGYEAFSILQDNAGVHIVSYNTLDTQGHVVPLTPILDTRITMQQTEKSAIYSLTYMQNELKKKGVRLMMGTFSINRFNKPITLNIVNGTAREVLEAILSEVHYKATWRILCGPPADGCALNFISL